MLVISSSPQAETACPEATATGAEQVKGAPLAASHKEHEKITSVERAFFDFLKTSSLECSSTVHPQLYRTTDQRQALDKLFTGQRATTTTKTRNTNSVNFTSLSLGSAVYGMGWNRLHIPKN
ncbi:uncharacterized protein FSUBG_6149 [Fusarium subglutinans]|uniref:Uncharacterized protein n=1 Tax=Gibberella subglutinans TaxID=42677 RepID=A0A8H5V0S0_GIBSU|nr:uncharacterized protein FSUBG_6149 [Fusarium subglutinans]KAF5606316.1 hypothetical protein FSUBG_6149 [Fusarium subglutinans]